MDSLPKSIRVTCYANVEVKELKINLRNATTSFVFGGVNSIF